MCVSRDFGTKRVCVGERKKKGLDLHFGVGSETQSKTFCQSFKTDGPWKSTSEIGSWK